MTWTTFGPLVAYDPTSKKLLPDAVGQVHASDDTSFATPLALRDLAGVTKSELRANADGMLDEFQVDIPDDSGEVNWKSGTYILRLVSYSAVKAKADQALADAAAVRAEVDAFIDNWSDAAAVLPAGGSNGDILYRSGERAGTWGPAPSGGGTGGGTVSWASIPDKPTFFPPEGHTHPVSAINGLANFIRTFLGAGSAAEARAAIGAGTGNGTSNLQVGVGGAAAYAHTHTAVNLEFTPVGNITATNIQDAVQQSSELGGSGGSSTTLTWRQRPDGSWPTLPATKPQGLEILQAYGTTAPTSAPGWVGPISDASKALMSFDLVPAL